MELTVALICTIPASLLVAVETTLTGFSRERVEKLVESGVHGAEWIRLTIQDPAPSTNAVMSTRVSSEATTMAFVALVAFQNVKDTAPRLMAFMAILLVVLLILQGVAPRTIGRQHPEWIMRLFAPLVSLLTMILGPVAQLMILLGNALTPRRGFLDGPFTSEAEFRDLVDIAETNEVTKARESKMVHSVLELGGTLIRRVMTLRIDMVWVPRDHALR